MVGVSQVRVKAEDEPDLNQCYDGAEARLLAMV